MKREAGDEPAGQPPQHKKHRRGSDHRYDGGRQDRRYDNGMHDHPRDGRSNDRPHNHASYHNGPRPQKKAKQPAAHDEALAKLPPSTTTSADVPAYIPFPTALGLPALPDIRPGVLQSAPFKHKSVASYDRSTTAGDVTYERLEFLGDAYIELIASRLIFERYPALTAGQQSQLRELLVKNETLAAYSRAYAFDDRIEIGSKDRMLEDVAKKHPGNKGFNKVLGDVFEAYVAAVILSDVEHGFAVAEKWLTTLWAPKLLEQASSFAGQTTSTDSTDPLASYNPTAKADLQKRILAPSDVRLEYERYADSIELKGAQLGQNKHFIAVYLTGYGYERKLLGKGEGRNMVEAGNWAAQQAMFGESRGVVEECEGKLKELKEKRRREREEREAKASRAED